ncbi:MAG: LLM class flavin-dependent oxidoreductase [Xanthobacteraceae bacterium]|nr:LLM class flavin-dependent oxidoreductase [Xanthobacteraceae bacterium]
MPGGFGFRIYHKCGAPRNDSGATGGLQSPECFLGRKQMALEFGIFDHVDRHDQPLRDFYEDRLKLMEAYDRAGIYGYHCAEHHSTPLGMAPSPSVYLAAVSQRTRRLNFGPLVYTLALYHPLRLAEEICMLDQMSRGRFLLGIGKGISPIEVGYYGVDFKNADKMFAESFAIIMQALTKKTVDYEGKFFRFRNVPMELEPFRQPHPPLWYGVVNPDSAERAARAGMNFISNSTAAMVKAKVARYSAAHQPTAANPAPKFGMNRYMVLAETEEKALEIGRRAYRRWWKSFMSLWQKHGTAPTNVNYPPEIDGQIADGRAIATTPAKALDILRGQLAESGANYLVCRFAFGDLSLSESTRSLELFQRHVMQGLRESVPVAAE